MKRLLALALAAVLGIAVAGCSNMSGGSDSTPNTAGPTSASQNGPMNNGESKSMGGSSSGKPTPSGPTSGSQNGPTANGESHNTGSSSGSTSGGAPTSGSRTGPNGQ